MVSLLAVVGKIGEKRAKERGRDEMEAKQIVTIGMFCLNETCTNYKKLNKSNVIKYVQTDKGV